MGWACTTAADKAAAPTSRLDRTQRGSAPAVRCKTDIEDKALRFMVVPSGTVDDEGMLRALRVGSLRLR
jgi:hypothetical protein